MSVVKGSDVAKNMTERLVQQIKQLKEEEIYPHAVIVRVGDNPSSIAYGKGATKKWNL